MQHVLIVCNLCFICSVITDADKMLRKLGSVCHVPEPELERYLYLQLFNREDERIMYRVKVTEKQVTHGSTFQLSAIWSPRTLWSAKGDFICFGRQASLHARQLHALIK